MKLKHIEINGFKSFPEKIKIEIHEGITCFVGPNGAGKSNIVDAFRWVLGESNPKILRGEKMEDVIFQGSATKKERGLAEVALLLEIEKNKDGNESEFENIEIKRKVYRIGDSEFFINGKQVKLKDIKEIFISKGVDIKNYAIVDQQKLNEVLFKPSQRKILLEECAGISIYKLKKNEAEFKLSSAQGNLQRIEDIIAEIKRQYSMLEKQAKKAEKYKRTIEELKNLELRVAKKESSVFLNKIQSLSANIEEKRKKLEELQMKKAIIISEIEKLKIQRNEKEKNLIEKEGKKRELEREMNKLEKALVFLTQQIKIHEELIERLENENFEINEELHRLEQNLKSNINEKIELEAFVDSIKNEIINLEKEILDNKIKLQAMESDLENKRKLLFNLSSELANKKNIYLNLNKTSQTTEHMIETVEEKINKTNEKLKYLLSTKHKQENVIHNLKNFLDSLCEKEKELKTLLIKIDEEIEEKSQLLINAKKQEAILSGKIESIQSEIWESGKDNVLFLDLIEVEPDLEEAIETYFADKLKATVIESIEYIDNNNNQKYYFLKNFGQKTSNSLDSLETLDRFIKIKENTISPDIFRNVIVIDNLNQALELKKLYPLHTFLTRKGEILFPDGFIKLKTNKRIFKKKKELEKLIKEKDEITKEISSLTDRVNELKNKRRQLETLIEKYRVEFKNTNTELIEREEKHKSLSKEISNIHQTIGYLQKEKEALLLERKQNSEMLEKVLSEIDSLSKGVRDTETRIDELKNCISTILTKNEEVSELLSTKKIELNTLNERIKSKIQLIEKVNEQIKKLSAKSEKNLYEIKQNRMKIMSIQKEIRDTEVRVRELEKFLQIYSQDIESMKELVLKDIEVLEKYEEKYRIINDEIHTITNDLSNVELQLRESTIKLENLRNEIYNFYGIDILNEDIEEIEGEDIEVYKLKINNLKNQLKEIGPVDTEILKEFELVRERYEFLTKQQKDLLTSIRELEMAIRKMNSLTKKKLNETFNMLKQKYNLIFSEIFEGGKADLYLTDEENILDSDIDIYIQLPGKKLSNISLLSGGEKTLSALAFVFACLSVRPSPICIFDEVDATLDDPNTLKLRKLIKELSKDTQFLIVTHNKLMMEQADYIYGVTMQEEGVSSIISIKLSEANSYL